jgi:hypothetical protein
LLHPLIPQHLVIDPHVFALDGKGGLGRFRVDDKVVIAVGAVFVAILEFLSVFAKAFFALFAGKDHLETLQQRMGFLLAVAFGAVEPFSTYGLGG